ncbi:hypothetical protein GCM10027294_21520 [Marinactinospora endophytica]
MNRRVLRFPVGVAVIVLLGTSCGSAGGGTAQEILSSEQPSPEEPRWGDQSGLVGLEAGRDNGDASVVLIDPDDGSEIDRILLPDTSWLGPYSEPNEYFTDDLSHYYRPLGEEIRIYRVEGATEEARLARTVAAPGGSLSGAGAIERELQYDPESQLLWFEQAGSQGRTVYAVELEGDAPPKKMGEIDDPDAEWIPGDSGPVVPEYGLVGDPQEQKGDPVVQYRDLGGERKAYGVVFPYEENMATRITGVPDTVLYQNELTFAGEDTFLVATNVDVPIDQYDPVAGEIIEVTASPELEIEKWRTVVADGGPFDSFHLSPDNERLAVDHSGEWHVLPLSAPDSYVQVTMEGRKKTLIGWI